MDTPIISYFLGDVIPTLPGLLDLVDAKSVSGERGLSYERISRRPFMILSVVPRNWIAKPPFV